MNLESAYTHDKVVELSDVSFSYDGSRPVLEGVSLSVEKGNVVMVLGPSGSGKTTLLKLVKGLIRPQSGEIRWGLDPVKEIAYVPQTLGLVRNLTVLENVLIGALSRISILPSLLKVFPKDEIRRAEEKLEMLGLSGKEGQKAFHLSGGERQRVAIARVLMQGSQLILADEFISQLDIVRTLEIMELVRQIALTGVTFIITTHDVELVPKYGNMAIFIKEGRKIHECPATLVNEVTFHSIK